VTVEPALLLAVGGALVGVVVWLTMELRRLHVAITAMHGDQTLLAHRTTQIEQRVEGLHRDKRDAHREYDRRLEALEHRH